ncbi:MAG: SDR family NAD(P)-dependent oxidoreductase [Alphaproteobacteria bacterium]|nr:SDR family NAD(P)-dependent oxidoreductase [Alphaproteobacteria bacterium]MDP6516462.1 SDR family NAD(P)-dependent oxidoreductase [Alphaproteobacteria bacterium]
MSYHRAKVLVTGADGFIGSRLVERLAEADAAVTALSLYNSLDSHGWLDDLEPGVTAAITRVRGDVRDPAFMMRLCADQDVIFHLAALIAVPHSYGAAQSYVDVNVTGLVNVLEAARAHRPRRVIVTSTSEVYGTARFTPITEQHPLHGQSPYAASKIAADMMAEAYVRSFELPVVILRPFNTYGPRQSERAVIASTIRQALDPACPAIRLGETTTRRDFTYVDDTAAAFMAAGGSARLDYGSAYNAGTGIAVTIADMAAAVRRLTGTNKPIESESARLRPTDSEVRALLADSTRLADATGWRAETPLDAGLAHTIEWWRRTLASGRVRADGSYLV